MSHIKYTAGTVVQLFDDEGVCIDQYFNAGDRSRYVDGDTGKEVNPTTIVDTFTPYDMVQPFYDGT